MVIKCSLIKAFSLFLYIFIYLPMSAQSFQKDVYIDKHDSLLYNILKPVGIEKSGKDNIHSQAENERYPLILFLHGSGERGNDNERQLIHIRDLFSDTTVQRNYPAFIVAPQCPTGKRWVETDWRVSKHIMPKDPSVTLVLVMKLLQDLQDRFPIDQHRIYVTGLSMGGFGTWDLICRYPEKFAAAIPVCGGGDANEADKLVKMPIWVFHGSDDKVVKVNLSRDMVKAIKDKGGNVKYTEYEGVGHDSWVKAYKEKNLLNWLFSQKSN